MRPLAAALVGGLAGAAATISVVVSRATPDQVPATPDPELLRALARIEARIERIERSTASRPREDLGPVRSSQVPVPPAAPPETPGGGDRPTAPAATDQMPGFSKIPSPDLALEADERYERDTDIAGAVQRYRELLSRGGTRSERMRWFIRLGDCYSRRSREDDAAQAYRDCIDASTEDCLERVLCMLALARHEREANPGEAQRWVERALATPTGEATAAAHKLAADFAREQQQEDREARELTWLIENEASDVQARIWKSRLAELRGEKR